MKSFDVIIVGGGIAGLTAAIHLARENFNVFLLEKSSYPRHKVCGEYVSNEVKSYLDSLEVPLTMAVPIDSLQLSTREGRSLQAKLPVGGMGISRYCLDTLLYNRAKEAGVTFCFETVVSITQHNNSTQVSTESGNAYKAGIVIGAYGKRANLDKHLKRPFIHKKSSWLGVKAHYRDTEHPSNVVGLHSFNGGYGGLSQTESGTVNFCYLAHYNSFKKEKNIQNFNRNVVAQNPFLSAFLERATMEFSEPISIAQISFEKKNAVHQGILMCGDAAGMIHPLCGNGIAMAIHSAKMASELISTYFHSAQQARITLERRYTREWNTTFARRLFLGRKLQSLLLNSRLTSLLIGTMTKYPPLVQGIIRNTHGKTLLVA